MARYEFKLPDIGEGIAEAEIVAWHVKVGDTIEEDQQLADMMTDKATVEMESPVAGKVIELAGEVGDKIPIGSVLVVIETEGADRAGRAGRGQRGRAPARRRRGRSDAGAWPRRFRSTLVLQPLPSEAKRARPSGRCADSRERTARLDPVSRRKRERGAPRPRLARGPRARPRSRHRPWPGEDRRRPHPPRRPRRLSALQRRQRLAPRRRRRAPGRDDQGRRPAPQDRREHAGGEAPHPAFHLGRGISTSPRSRRRAR